MKVKAWKEIVTIPTYSIGKPEKNPVFLEKRVYQGSSGAVYPHPVIEKIFDDKINKKWNAVFLENKYLKIMILPELGGRIQMAFDKTKNRHFVYYNQVIKPALVGLAGPWISGGIEFNWPQHHRPSTYEPLESLIEENADGSITVWCSEVERMFRTKGMAGFTLYPERAYLEIKVNLYNRTPHPQTFLWWANPAVHVNDEYQSVFPPDVNAVFDHGKRDVSRFPIATGTYYKVDYSAGVDISRYKNIPVPTSYMAITSKYDFVGGYENDTKGGLLHVANHHVSPGKKQWTWGNGDFGKAWDRNLTDENGPYIELMCGVYTDNQPDFSWIMPYEERTFNQYFMPYRDLGVVKNATKDAMINLEFSNGTAIIKAYCTGEYKGAKIILTNNGERILNESFDFSPENSFEKTVSVESGLKHEDFIISVLTANDKVLVSWQPEKEEIRPIPDAAKPAKEPKDISSIEQLYLTGLHLVQYRHATYNPADYYIEALSREPGDIRCNNAMGLLLMRKGQFQKAEPYFRAAIATLTERNPNPYDGEPLFNLGLCLRFQYKYNEAYTYFYKSAWNVAWQDAAYFNLAQLAVIKGDWDDALELISRSLVRNWHNHKARHLKVTILRKLQRTDEAKALIANSLELDKFNFGVLYEKYLLEENRISNSAHHNERSLENLKELMRGNIHNYIEYSLDYAIAGLYTEATSFLEIGIENADSPYPMAYYFLGWYANHQGDSKSAKAYFEKAEKIDPDCCFPNRLEEVLALQCANTFNPGGAKAFYYLGNFWYAARQYNEAIDCWEKSERLDGNFPTVRRNLALAYFNKLGNIPKATFELEKAFSLNTADHRILMELDQLYKKLNKPFAWRLKLLEKHSTALEYRDDLYLEVATLYNLIGKHEKALDLIMKRKFHPWEGGEGKVTGQYLFAHTEIAKKAITEKDYNKALSHLEATNQYPHNLGEGKLFGAQENDINYWKGCACYGLGEENNAKEYWQRASIGLSEPSTAMFYNDQQPDKIFYQGLALLKLGKTEDANGRFHKLRDYGEKHIFDKVKIDYFAVSLPDLQIWDDDLQKRNTLHCQYLMGLGFLGFGQKDKARALFENILKVDINHTGSHVHLKMC
jgi:tetratricopeptide (TPR) repeat protein